LPDGFGQIGVAPPCGQHHDRPPGRSGLRRDRGRDRASRALPGDEEPSGIGAELFGVLSGPFQCGRAVLGTGQAGNSQHQQTKALAQTPAGRLRTGADHAEHQQWDPLRRLLARPVDAHRERAGAAPELQVGDPVGRHALHADTRTTAKGKADCA
jgi:hypothetical protein